MKISRGREFPRISDPLYFCELTIVRDSSSSTAKWSCTISLVSRGAGYGLFVDPINCFEFDDDDGYVEPEIQRFIGDAKTQLKTKLESLIDAGTIEYLRDAFCGVWPMFYSGAHGYTLCNPRFNEQGDFVLELESPLTYTGEWIDNSRSDFHLPGMSTSNSQPAVLSHVSPGCKLPLRQPFEDEMRGQIYHSPDLKIPVENVREVEPITWVSDVDHSTGKLSSGYANGRRANGRAADSSDNEASPGSRSRSEEVDDLEVDDLEVDDLEVDDLEVDESEHL